MPQVSSQLFADRAEAGALLAARFAEPADRDDGIVLGLPRGGVAITYEVASGVKLVNHDVVDALGISGPIIEQLARREEAELERRERLYRGLRPTPRFTSKIVILCDDGLATGSTMRAAVTAVRRQDPAQVIVAVPVGAPATCSEMSDVADEVACLRSPEPFIAVGLWYRDFAPTSDAEVRELLGRSAS